jgi:hypothetical protein
MSNSQTAFCIIPTSVVESPDLTVNEKFMMVVLSSFANREGKCWPSIATLAARSNLSESYVKRLCARLVEMGLLATERRGRRSNIYHILWLSDVNPGTPKTYGTQSDTTEGNERQSDTINDVMSANRSPLNLPIRRTYQEELTTDATARETDILETLRSVPRYSDPFDTAKELTFIRTLVADFPAVDILAEVKKWRAYKLDVPLVRTSRPHNQIHEWMKRSGTFAKPPTISADEYNERLLREDAL